VQKNRTTTQINRKVSSRAMIITLAGLIPMTVICVSIACGRVTQPTDVTPIPAVAEKKNASEVAGRPQQPGRDEVRIELTNNGFKPAAVTHLAGTFAIAVENTSARDEYTLRLKAEDGTVLKEIQVQKGSTAWSVSLQPGLYALSEANHEQWICRINVQ
jgi:hypothetical protein